MLSCQQKANITDKHHHGDSYLARQLKPYEKNTTYTITANASGSCLAKLQARSDGCVKNSIQ
jgi:hypothetical protein